MTLGQAAKYLGVSESTMRKWASEGRLPAFSTPGGHRRFRTGDLDTFLDGARVAAKPDTPPVVLVVDDDEHTRALVRVGLEAAGYVVEEAGSAEEGLAAVEEHPPDLILLDVAMQELDGVEMLCRLRDNHGLGAVPVIMFGGEEGPGASRIRTLTGKPDVLKLIESAKQVLAVR